MFDVEMLHVQPPRPSDISGSEDETLNGNGGGGKPRRKASGSPTHYARRIHWFATQAGRHELFPGEHYSHLSRYLTSASDRRDSYSQFNSPADEAPPFCTFYPLSGSVDHQVGSTTKTDLEVPNDLNSLELNKSNNRLLFLSGWASAEWLCQVGWQFDIDPEFFYRHLDFSSSHGNLEYHCLPRLPSSTDALHIHFTSLGSWDTSASEWPLGDIREECRDKMEQYTNDLVAWRGICPADSIVRRFCVHDKRRFSIEQKVSIYLKKKEDTWTVLIWSDVGADLSKSIGGPWLSIQRYHSQVTRILPIFQHQSHLALHHKPQQQRSLETQADQSLAQSISRLRDSLGKSLNSDVMACDAFYCLTEIFRAAANSELQFLNYMTSKIEATVAIGPTALDGPEDEGYSRIPELQAIIGTIDNHCAQIKETLTAIKDRGGKEWPQAEEGTPAHSVAEAAASDLEKDYQYLLSRAETLSRTCSSNISIIMNDAMYRESQKAIQQSKEIAKLTLLAFFFVPLSFTTSFFGMNFAELNEGPLSVWVWFAASLPVLMISALVLFGNKIRAIRWAGKKFRKLRRAFRRCRF